MAFFAQTSQVTAGTDPRSYGGQRNQRRCFGLGLGDDFAVVEFDDAVGELEIFIIVGYDEHGFAASFELGQQLSVEDVLEVRVLIGGPLVEKVERTVFKIG